MKAIALWQPWASLIAVGAKLVETRGWRAPSGLIGERLAIHATLTRDWLHMCDEEPFNEYIGGRRDELPLGAIVATAVLDRCAKITHERGLELHDRNWHEAAFGNYAPGRFAWVLRDVHRLAEPVPFRGMQSVFEVPDQLVAGAAVAAGGAS